MLAVLWVATLSASTADAQRGDGVYHRWDRDLTLSVSAGAGLDRHAGETSFSGVAEARLRVLDTAGPVIAGRFGERSSLFVGVELRPLFPALFLIDKPISIEFWDLLVQSIGVELGVAYVFDQPRGFAFAYGFSVEVPLVLPSKWSREGAAEGVWLRLSARRISATRRRAGEVIPDAEGEWSVMAQLAIKFGLHVGAAAWEPPRYRRE